MLRPTRRADDLPDAADNARADHERRVRQARLELARRQQTWTEIPETRLVSRGRFLVDAETDLVYMRRRGVVFEPGRSTIGYVPEGAAMSFYVDTGDNIVFVEHPGGLETWSELMERKARRGKATT